MFLVLILLSTYAGAVSAQEKTGEEGLVEGMVANLNAYWEEQFRLLGHPYSPATLIVLYDHELVVGPCGLAFTGLGPGYCPGDEALYYPVDWVDPSTGLRLEQYGEPAVEMVVAHEMAHHAQLQMQKLGIPGGRICSWNPDGAGGRLPRRSVCQPSYHGARRHRGRPGGARGGGWPRTRQFSGTGSRVRVRL
jgi:hypothetical protein